MRVVRSTINNKYTQPLKLSISPRLVVAPGVDYNSVCLTNKHRRTDELISLKVHAKFDSENFDGCQLLAYLSKDNERPLSVGSCEFRLYSISSDDSWTETLEDTITATVTGNRCMGSIAQASVTKILEGEFSFAVVAEASRLDKTYKEKIYFNHLGTYDSIVRLRNKINFLQITKKDFGV